MIIFLDIDGVVATTKTYKQWRGSGCPQTIAGYASLLDPALLAAVDRLVQDCGGRVVISSTWRHLTPVVDILRCAGFTSPIIGFTPQVQDDKGSYMRGHEISAWIVQNNVDVKDVLILDDCSSALKAPDGNPRHGARVVQTDSSVGITRKQLQRARKMVGIDIS